MNPIVGRSEFRNETVTGGLAGKQVQEDGVSQVVVQNLKSLRELCSRLSRIADTISGCQPGSANTGISEESSLAGLTNSEAYAISECHDEANRIIRGLGIQP
jgi:hypothetical protein